jgi:nucleotide-binding universal stress UspA family protein
MDRTLAHEPDRSHWRVVVAADGSDGSAAAIEWTARLASTLRAEVVAVHALEPPVIAGGYAWLAGLSSPSDWSEAWQAWSDRVRETLEREWCDPLRKAGLSFRAIVIKGGSGGLLSYLHDAGADVLIVGRRGLGGFAELIVGSFSHKLVHHSPIPVLVVPLPDHDAKQVGADAGSATNGT